MKRMIRACMILTLVLALTGCGASKPQIMKLSLESNPTTGYSWELVQEPELFNVGEEYVEDAHEEDLVGVGGRQIFSLAPMESGTTELTFTYARSWESADTAEMTISYTVEVDKNLQIKITSSRLAGGDDIDTLPQIPEPTIE